jgi:hypothetical protein
VYRRAGASIFTPSGNFFLTPVTDDPPLLGDTTWQHVSWTIDFALGLSSIYQNGVLIANQSADFGGSLLANGRFSFGRGLSDTYFGRPAVVLGALVYPVSRRFTFL